MGFSKKEIRQVLFRGQKFFKKDHSIITGELT